ncbi:MAG: hypothetical protein ABI771_14555 [Betaproteobacteria bacterium]
MIGTMSSSFYKRAARGASSALPLLAFLLCSACATSGGDSDEVDDPTLVAESATDVQDAPVAASEDDSEAEVEVPAAVAESEHLETQPKSDNLPEVVVRGRERHVVIRDLVAEGQAQLRGVELQYAFTGKGRREVLRGRPVAFALWSESKKSWTIAQLEIPRPPLKWKPGRGPLPFAMRTPGIEARHVKGTGAERLMFAFSRDGEELKVYGRKFPVFNNTLIKKKRWREAAATARPIVYLPFTEDTLDPQFVTGGRDFLLATARRAMEELRNANVPSAAFPGEQLANVIPAEVITTLAVIEQTDDEDFVDKGRDAFDEVLSQYGLKREEAYRYSVSSAKALGPMQFTNRRGNGTYSLVVRRCRGAQLEPNFERGATHLLNVMKAAVCLLDIELSQMTSDIRTAYRANPEVLGIFAVAAYNGGPRNVAKLYRALDRMGVQLGDLRRAGAQTPGSAVACPCVWREEASVVRAVSIPRYNRENIGYIEKYQNILSLFE